MNLVTGETSERALDDVNAEFPMIAPHVMGQKNRFAYLHAIPHEIPATFDALLKVDIHTGKTERYDYGPGVYGSEAPFAARPGATEEDDGYVMTFVTDTADWSSRCLVFDAKHISDGPVATVHIPFRVPAGFHATWMDASEWA
jgi:carotenoid cleavage dioxygenase